ncbi:MAG: hypothetical protein SGJ09_15420 [Phycisphaerae bacterium]|nr:hypothetical protein [Phycisphaerae bacterium]
MNSPDLSILLGAWGKCSSCLSDLSNDGVVGSAALAMLLGAWN